MFDADLGGQPDQASYRKSSIMGAENKADPRVSLIAAVGR
jgi:hypothetical protein